MNTSPDIISILGQVPIFAGLDSEVLLQLASRCRRRKFNSKEALFHEGDPGHTLYVILSGRVNIEKTTISGEIVHIAQRGSGDHFGEMALLDESPRSADAITQGRCDLLMLDRTEFLACLAKRPVIAVKIIASLVARLREAAEQRAESQALDVTERLCALIVQEVEAQSAAKPQTGVAVGLEGRLTQQEIADRIGSSREAVNRSLSRLKQLNAIAFEGRRIVVLNIAKLKQYCLQ